LIPGNRQGASDFLHRAAVAALLICSAATLAACSGLAASGEEALATGPDPAYQQLVANYLRSTFKDYQSYDSFEISDPRWVHALQGWSWLTCVRFQDRGRSRTYALFLQSGKIVDGRYAVETDGCGTQPYAPFGLITGGLQPLH
jgi:hypothetical protein